MGEVVQFPVAAPRERAKQLYVMLAEPGGGLRFVDEVGEERRLEVLEFLLAMMTASYHFQTTRDKEMNRGCRPLVAGRIDFLRSRREQG